MLLGQGCLCPPVSPPGPRRHGGPSDCLRRKLLSSGCTYHAGSQWETLSPGGIWQYPETV